MSHLGRRSLIFVALAAALFGVQAAYAQDPEKAAGSGRISGLVRGADGGAVAVATVRITNVATGASRTVTTGPDGRYVLTGLMPGAYTVSASLFGFRGTSSRITVQVTGAAAVDLELEPVQVEAITVTAMLREQQIMDVPFSIAAPTAHVLRSRGADNIEGIAINVAGFSVQNLGPGQSQVAMRGASSGQIARDQPGVKEQVGAYLDDVPISLSLFTPDLDLFDVARVEVLRGPQGTLFGSGSTAGTVRYISNQPQLGSSSFFGEVGGSAAGGGSIAGILKLGANVPLGAKAAGRISGYYTGQPGYMDAVQPGRSVDEDVNNGYRAGVRAALRFLPSENFSITPRVVFQKVETDGWNRIDVFNILANPFTTSRDPVTLGERELFTQIDEPFTDEFLVGSLDLRYHFGSVDLTSITSLTARDVLVVRDAGALTSSITGGSIGLPESVYTLDSPLDDATESRVWTQEVRLAGGSDRVNWLVGGFYSDNHREYGQSLLVSGFQAATGIPTQGLRAARDVLFFSDLSYDLRQFALFGEGTLAVSDRLDLTAGLRYYNFDEEREQIFDGIFAHDNTGTSLLSQPGSINADGLAPRFIASFKASPNLTVNAQAARGFRLGGINDPLNKPLCTPQDLATFDGRDSWQDETVWNYEIGTKSRLMNGRASLNLSAFYMDISDLQVTVTAGSCSSRLIFNVPKARSQGLEAEFTATPSENFDFSISGSFNDSELRSTLTSTSSNGQVSVVSGIREGNRLPSVPQFQGAAAATYRRQMGTGSVASVTGSFQHIGSRFTEIGNHAEGFGTVNLNSFGANTIGGPLTQATFRFDPELPAYDLVNLRLALTRANWELGLFANNLTDERALLALDQERGTRARVGFLTNQPRTFGVTLRFNN
ncbi:MAG: TonB-dependent receptor [Gemmatimonadota bacterium]